MGHPNRGTARKEKEVEPYEKTLVFRPALAISLSLVCLPVLAQEAPAEYDPQTVVKDETVYVTLTSAGEAKETIVVNRLEAGQAGIL